jgi:hypothetical protein
MLEVSLKLLSLQSYLSSYSGQSQAQTSISGSSSPSPLPCAQRPRKNNYRTAAGPDPQLGHYGLSSRSMFCQHERRGLGVKKHRFSWVRLCGPRLITGTATHAQCAYSVLVWCWLLAVLRCTRPDGDGREVGSGGELAEESTVWQRAWWPWIRAAGSEELPEEKIWRCDEEPTAVKNQPPRWRRPGGSKELAAVPVGKLVVKNRRRRRDWSPRPSWRRKGWLLRRAGIGELRRSGGGGSPEKLLMAASWRRWSGLRRPWRVERSCCCCCC